MFRQRQATFYVLNYIELTLNTDDNLHICFCYKRYSSSMRPFSWSIYIAAYYIYVFDGCFRTVSSVNADG